MSNVKPFLYRVSTMWDSFKALYKLTPGQVDAFVQSFEIFEHDWKDEKKLKEAYGDDYYAVVKRKLLDYYSVLNYICSLGSLEKMYIPAMLKPEQSLCKNQELFEERMMMDLKLSGSARVLDIGCGRGRIAAHVTRVTKAHVTGINIDDEQLKNAKEFAKRSKLDNRLAFEKVDMNNLPLPFQNGELDAVYHIQVFSFCKNLPQLLSEIYRILKPGGRMSSCDWAVLDNYDAKNAEHVKLVNSIKPLVGAVGTPSSKEYIDAFKQAGFKIIKAEVPSAVSTDAENIDKASKEYGLIHGFINFFVKARIFPKHFKTLLEQLSANVDKLIEVDRRGLATTNFHIVAEK